MLCPHCVETGTSWWRRAALFEKTNTALPGQYHTFITEAFFHPVIIMKKDFRLVAQSRRTLQQGKTTSAKRPLLQEINPCIIFLRCALLAYGFYPPAKLGNGNKTKQTKKKFA